MRLLFGKVLPAAEQSGVNMTCLYRNSESQSSKNRDQEMSTEHQGQLVSRTREETLASKSRFDCKALRLICLFVIISSCLFSNTAADSSSIQIVQVNGDLNVDGNLTPPRIQITFTLNGALVTLNLIRNDNISPNIPVIVFDIVTGKANPQPTGQSVGKGYYYDTERTASIMLTITFKGDGTLGFQITGTFMSQNKEYTILPLYLQNQDTGNRRRRRWSKRSTDDQSHTVAPINTSSDSTMGQALPMPTSSTRPPPLFQDEGSVAGTNVANYTVELLVGVDYTLYKKWYNMSTGSTPQERDANTINDLKYYFAHVINGVDARYRTIQSSAFRIRVRLVGLYIATNSPGASFMENNRVGEGTRAYINSQNAIYDLYNFASSNIAILPAHDQFTLFTGDNMNGNTGNRIAGLSFHEGMCTYYALSLVRESGLFGSTTTAAHELGHSIGALHDGYDNACNARDDFIMAPGPAAITDSVINNVFRFSACSINEMTNFFTKVGLAGVTCLLTDQSVVVPSNVKDILPGQWYTPDQQCQIIYGTGSFYCSGKSLDPNICRNMQCFHPDWQYCVSTYTQIAFTGTSCGNNKWCQQAKCVYNASAPAAKDVCLYGDFKGPLLNGMYCKSIQAQSYFCYEPFVEDSCCTTCMAIRDDSRPDCLYGDRDSSCNAANLNCNDPSVQARCCKTCSTRSACESSWCQINSGSQCYTYGNSCCDSCSPFQTSVPGCQYGDKMDSCSTMQPYQCYSGAATCCQTCAKYETSMPNCKYGDRSSSMYCTGMTPTQCYTRGPDCCASCQQFATGIQGCDYGDKDPTCTIQDCTNPTRTGICCKTCYGFSTPTPTTTTTTITTTTTSPATTTKPYFGGDGDCVDKLDWCSTISAWSCYSSTVTQCCYTCSKMYIPNSQPGCEFGDYNVWCTNKTCNSPSDRQQCCVSCAYLNNAATTPSTSISTSPTTSTVKTTTPTTTTPTTTTTTPTTTLTTTTRTTTTYKASNTCIDSPLITWCKDMDALLCYNSNLRATCCASCKLKNTGVKGCEYGDKLTTCVNIKKDQCNYYSDDCCKMCSSNS